MSECLFTKCIEAVKDIKGDVAEFGILRGLNFVKIAKAANIQDKRAYAFDSFIGMPISGEFDGKGYPEGKFDMGGPASFIERMRKLKIKNYTVVEGFIPKTLAVHPNLQLSFAYVDIDHYATTRDLLEWLAPRMSMNGLILCDDYFPTRVVKVLASKAIEEVLETELTFKLLKHIGKKALIRKEK